jgi:tetratricopeptide (TPR) repeat protein
MYSRTIVDLEGKIRTQATVMGCDSLQIADSLCQLAHLYFIFSRYPEAERLLWRAIAIRSKWLGQEHLSVAELHVDLGYLLETQDRYADAEEVYRLAYAIRSVSLGHGHHESLQVGRLIVKVMRAQGRIPLDRELERLSKVAV